MTHADPYMTMNFFATCPKGVEALLQDELTELGITENRQTVSGVYFSGELVDAYRVCLWGRLPNRVLLSLYEGECETADDLYNAVQQVQWLDHLRSEGTLTVDFTGKGREINNTRFGAQRVKDAIVDQIRQLTNNRPSVDRASPDIRVNVHLHKGKVSVAIDLSGESLHRRGYRKETGAAPMKENLAAAVLRRAGWHHEMAERKVLLDPMCGAGTLLVEAALMAADIAPGILRERFGFRRWLKHDRSLWADLMVEARARKEEGLAKLSHRFIGQDLDRKVLGHARTAADNAGVGEFIEFKAGDAAHLEAPEGTPENGGMLISNPPYAERLGEAPQIIQMYKELGYQLKEHFAHWKVALFSGNPDQCRAVGLKADKHYKLYNGAIECRLFLYTLYPQDPERKQKQSRGHQLTDTAEMFANRLKKNRKQLAKWARKNDIECYRIYDADMPEYSVAIDVYGDWLHIQEYQPPRNVDQIKAYARLQDVVQLAPEVLEVNPARVVLKQRSRQKGTEQYQRQDETKNFFEVAENGCRLKVNLHDYLDTGLFLDHRPARKMVKEQSSGKDVLNLFCYTGTASVHAAAGGAKTTTSVDMSATYLGWAMQNMELNGYSGGDHRFVQSDCIKWLKSQRQPAYDLIFMDPPTFSNSKRMDDVLDVQRDHVELIRLAMAQLRPDGKLIFSNNNRRFKLDYDALAEFEVRDISARTIDMDFKRNPRIHVCFEIVHSS